MTKPIEMHPEVKKLVIAWCDKVPYVAIWDKIKLAEDIHRCMDKINKQTKSKPTANGKYKKRNDRY